VIMAMPTLGVGDSLVLGKPTFMERMAYGGAKYAGPPGSTGTASAAIWGNALRFAGSTAVRAAIGAAAGALTAGYIGYKYVLPYTAPQMMKYMNQGYQQYVQPSIDANYAKHAVNDTATDKFTVKRNGLNCP